MNDSIITLKKITMSFREGQQVHAIFSDLDLQFRKGEICILLGRSGSGKSTLLNLIAGIDLPDKGQVFVNGREMTLISEKERTLTRRRQMGFVYQFYNLIPTLSVLENVLLPLDLSGEKAQTATDKALAMLEKVGLADRAQSFPDVLSGGEQQRVAIARALALNPPIILADEPTGNLDIDTGKKVLTLLDKLVRESGKTMIMATHSREVMGIADRTLTVHQNTFSESR